MTISEEMGKRMSALVDDELTNGEAGCLDEIKKDKALQQCWSRYHLVSDVLRHRETIPTSISSSSDFSQRLSAAIELEPAILAPGRFSRSKRIIQGMAKQVTGLAVAASVTMAVVFGVQYQGVGIPGGGGEMAANGSNALPASQVSPVVVKPIPAQQFNKYLVNHNEHVGSTAVRQGVLTYARIIDGSKQLNK